MTVGWSGLQFTHLSKVPLLLGFFNGSVVLVVRPRPWRTFPICPQSHALSVPPLLSSCLTGPPDMSRVSASLVNTWSPQRWQSPTPLPHHRNLLLQLDHWCFLPVTHQLLGSLTVLSRVSARFTVGDVVPSLPQALAPNLGSSVH